MGKLRPSAEVSIAGAATASAAICAVCNRNMTREREWPAGWQVFHCEGRSKAGVAHHHNQPTYGACWKCGGPLGCARCAARTRDEVICSRCGVWGTKEAFVEQGLLGGQEVDDYPTEWRQDYSGARAFQLHAPRAGEVE